MMILIGIFLGAALSASLIALVWAKSLLED